MSQLMRLSSIVLTMVAAAGCNPSSTLSPLGFVPGPTPAVYAGSIQDSLSGTGTLRLTLSTAAGVTSGTWTATFSGRTEATRFVSGVVANNVYTATVYPYGNETVTTSGCISSMTAMLSASGVSGNYSTFRVTASCPTAQTGSFTLTRQ